VVLGQVAPIPWVAEAAAQFLVGMTISEESAANAGRYAVANAIALSGNEYKIQLAQVSVKRAVLKAGGLETGGIEGPVFQQPTAASATDPLLL
jgi:CO/xanthine dehydrogenase FAD-binding subunit